MNALVTGSGGFLGSYLSRALVGKAQKLVLLKRDQTMEINLPWPHPPNGHEISIVKGDLSDPSHLERILSQYEINTVFHLAAQTAVGVAAQDPLGTWRSNVEGTWNMLEASRRQKVSRVIVASSDKCYGHTPPPYKEDHPVRASAVYETSKTCADLISQSYEQTFDMNIAITRCGNFYGPGRLNWSTLIPGTIRSIIEGRRPVLRSNGLFRRDFLYIDDGVGAYLKLAESNVRGPFNFGTGRPQRVIDVVNMICEKMGWKDGIQIIETAQNEIVDQYLDTGKARAELNWSPKVSFEDGIAKTIKWYRTFLKGAACS